MIKTQSILIIDDETNFSRILEAKLNKSGFDVSIAGSALAGLSALMNGHFPVVLMDVHVPDANGLDVLPLFRFSSPHSSFIIMTAYEEEGLAARALKAGAVDVLYKPFELDDLIKEIRDIVSEGPLSSAARSGNRLTPFPIGQRIAVTIRENIEIPARIKNRLGETLQLICEEELPEMLPGPVQVSMTGDDGKYEFRSRVLIVDSSRRTLLLSKPETIRRKQRRRYPRIPLDITVTTVPLEKGKQERTDRVKALDLSAGGMALVSSQPLKEGALVQLEWNFPFFPEQEEIYKVNAEVVRTDILSDAFHLHVYRSSVRFVSLPAATMGLIENYVMDILAGKASV